MICFHYKITPQQVDRLTLIQFNMLIETLNDHFERKAEANG